MSVRVTFVDHRADLRIQRPEVLNAMNWDVFDGLASAADEVSGSNARVAVVCGEGRSFSSGIDTSSFGDIRGDPAAAIARAQAGFRKISSLAIPTIAAVKGHALGAGLQLALACDLRIMADDASVGLLEANYGLVPDLCGTQRLPKLIGPGRAKKMIWLAERIDGREAGRIGLAEIVVPAADVEPAAAELAKRIAAAPPLVAREVKRLVDVSGVLSLDAGMDEEARAQEMMLASHDFLEAITAFVEKRSPHFTGA